MAIDLNGINNINEYYTNHYLSTIFEDNIKDIISKWRTESEEKDIKTPWSKIKEVRRKYFNIKEKFQIKKNTDDLLNLQRDFINKFLIALGYEKEEIIITSKDNTLIPLISEVKKTNGAPQIWILESCDFENKDEDILSTRIMDFQYTDNEIPKEFIGFNFEDIISKYIFSIDEPPRWVILIKLEQVVLIDRNKWAEKSLISFDLDEIFSRHIESTYHVLTVLLTKESICPDDGTSFLDTLSDNSHKHASSVSENLKYSLRRCIELLGNEAAKYMIEKKRKTYNRQLADELTIECIRYMYRILFILFIESRTELGYAPMKSAEYVNGYSIENLRDIVDNAKLDNDEAMEGYYFDESIKRLFQLIYEGYPIKKEKNMDGQYKINMEDDLKAYNTFKLDPLKAHLFDPDRLKLLNNVKFKNKVLYEVIKQMSISQRRNGKSKKERIGRISYSQLGIIQLGAVYESLLSYRGFFAEEDLYEVKKANDKEDELDVGYFVPENKLSDYDEDERVRNKDGTLKKYEKGTFIYRLAGRERIKSASYYTPEVLTKCLVKYSLKELLKDKKADDILKLKICEPAMGSAAFLNEAINQLAESYLYMKQKEKGEIIDHNEYIIEKQKVKMFIADRNVYGIDLNPVAVELAEVSLWLNTIYNGSYVPWFGNQLVCGNSLIGARRQVYNENQILKGVKKNDIWHNNAPERIKPSDDRNGNDIYHFLLSDPGMSDYKDKVISGLAPDNIKEIKDWKTEFVKPYTEDEVDILKSISNTIDDLWDKHLEIKKRINKMLEDPISIFGHKEDEKNVLIRSTKEKDKLYEEEYLSEGMRNSGPYSRLKFVMDYWCSLWFWPIQKSHLLPTRSEFIFEVQTILQGDVIPVKEEGQVSLFSKPQQQFMDLYGDSGQVNLDMLCESNERLRLVKSIAGKYKFLHWELEFVDVFKERGGFDFILGNPPWLKLTWEESGVLGDVEPKIVIKNYTSAETVQIRKEIVNKGENTNIYFAEFEEFAFRQSFINSIQNYPDLMGVQSNLYKCFLPQSWLFSHDFAIESFIHPVGIYDDPMGGDLRKKVYSKLRFHFQFVNQKILFDIGDRVKFSINIYCNNLSSYFMSISNLFYPTTIDESFEKNSFKKVGGIKNDEGNWNLNGHQDRLLKITKSELEIFSKVFDSGKNNFMKSKLPALHSIQILDVIRKFNMNTYRKIYEYKNEYLITVCFDESISQKKGIITRKVRFPENDLGIILSGSHIWLGNPLYKTSRAKCRFKSDFDNINLVNLNERYKQRVNYIMGDTQNFKTYLPKIVWDNKYYKSYKLASRKMLNLSGERTLITSILTKESSHINGLISIVLKDYKILAKLAGYFISIPYDFYVKVLGKSNLYEEMIGKFQMPDSIYDDSIRLRALLLNCLTKSYDELWQSCWNESFKNDSWSKSDKRLNPFKFKSLQSKWNMDTPLRYDYERRQALVEIDVLASMALGLTLDELKTIYRIQFPVLRSYEADTWYDKNGRIIFTVNRGLVGVGLDRNRWNEVKDMKTGTVEKTFEDDTMPGGPITRTIVYEAPFDKCDREADYETVWKHFEQSFGKQKLEVAEYDSKRALQPI